MKLLEKIRTAKTKQDLNKLAYEIVLSPDYRVCCEEFKKRSEELRDET